MLTLVTHGCPQVWVITVFINNAVSTLPPPSCSGQRVGQDTMSLAPLSPWASVATAFGSGLLFLFLCPTSSPCGPLSRGGHCSGLSHHSSQWVGRAGVFQGPPCQAIMRTPATCPCFSCCGCGHSTPQRALSRCSELCPGTAECQLTVNCSMLQCVPSRGRSPHASLRGQLPADP